MRQALGEYAAPGCDLSTGLLLYSEMLVMNQTIYVSYQGDVSDFHAVHCPRDECSENVLMIEKRLVECARACLNGWHRRNGKLHCIRGCFVVRANSEGFVAHHVQFDTDELREASICFVCGSEYLRELPTGWPDWIHQILR